MKQSVVLRVFEAFRRIGPPVTDHAEPHRYGRGVLTLRVAESVWMTELTFLRPELIDRINAQLGEPKVESLRVTLGSLSKRKRKTSTPPLRLSEPEARAIESWSHQVADPKVREAFVRAASRSLSNRR